MITNVLYFMPMFACLIWAATYILAKRTIRQTVMMVCLCIASIYFVSYALYTMPNTNYLRMVQVESVSLPLAFLLVSTLSIYANLLTRDVRVSPWHMVLTIPAIVTASLLGILYYIIGYENAAKFQKLYDDLGRIPEAYVGNRLYEAYVIVEQYLLMFFSLFFILVIISQCGGILYKNEYRLGDITRWALRKKKMPQTSISALCLITLMLLIVPVSLKNEFVMTHKSLGIALASALTIMIHSLAFTEFHNETKSKVSERLRKIEIYNRMVKQGLIDEDGKRLASFDSEEDIETIETQTDTETPESPELYTLRERRAQTTIAAFSRLMDDEKVFLDTDINVGAIAGRLGIGRTTLSTVLNDEYGKNFRSIINEYRIKYAKAYILENPSATQVEVAAACGFKDVSSYAHKFKELTGKSPLVWLLEAKEH